MTVCTSNISLTISIFIRKIPARVYMLIMSLSLLIQNLQNLVDG